MKIQNSKPFSLAGRYRHRIRNVAYLLWATIKVILRRLYAGPRVSGWTQSFEIANEFLRMQNVYSFDRENIDAGRAFFDSLAFYSPNLDLIELQKVSHPINGIWFHPPHSDPNKIILYFHGGGYAFFPRAYFGFFANMAHAASVSLFALDYPLIPESPYPSQLNAAVRAYEWLLREGYPSSGITVMGDSAGGNLCISLLLKLRTTHHTLPSSAVALCPWTDLGNSGQSMEKNEPFDWVEKRMAEQWAEWYLDGQSHEDEFISPIYADLADLPPIYIQAGGKEILLDMIEEFHARAIGQGAEIRLDVWENMTHNFQAYGDFLDEAKSALRRISQFIHKKA